MDPGAPLAAVEDASRVLFLAPQLEASTDSHCRTHLAEATGGPVLQVSFRAEPGGLVADWREHVGELPAEFAVVVVGSPGEELASPESVEIRTVSGAGDLTELGIAITRSLDGFEGSRPAVCLDSLTLLLQYVETEVAFRFIHTMGRYFAAADATVHAHLDPGAVDDRAVNSLVSLFDGVLVHESVGNADARFGTTRTDGQWHVHEEPP
jgi:hypothetical protein